MYTEFFALPLLALALIGVVSVWVFARFFGVSGWSDRVLYAVPREIVLAVSNSCRQVEPSFLGGQRRQSGFWIFDRMPNACRNEHVLFGGWQWWPAKQSRGTENRPFSHARESAIPASIFEKGTDALVRVRSSGDDDRTGTSFKQSARQLVSFAHRAPLSGRETCIDGGYNSDNASEEIDPLFVRTHTND